MLDELLLGGEVQETSKKNVLKAIAAQDLLQEVRTATNVTESTLQLSACVSRRITSGRVQAQQGFYIKIMIMY